MGDSLSARGRRASRLLPCRGNCIEHLQIRIRSRQARRDERAPDRTGEGGDGDDPTGARGGAAAAGAGDVWPDERVAWYACFVLMLTLLVNFLDRGIVGLLVPYIKADLHLSDSQIGLIMGFAFVMFYMIAGLPIARYADHGNRRTLIAIGMALWGGATALCGLAGELRQPVRLPRRVGVGEACTGPASFSLLGDYFRPHRLPKAIAFLNFGFIFGNGLAELLGATVILTLAAAGAIHFGLLGELRLWQAAFLICGVPGLLVGLLMLTVREPPRRVQGAVPSVGAVAAFRRRKSRRLSAAHRRHLAEHDRLHRPAELGAELPHAHLWLVDRADRPGHRLRLAARSCRRARSSAESGRSAWPWHGRHDANVRVSLYACAMGWPFLLAAPLMPNGWLSVGDAGAIGLFCTSLLFGPQNAAIQAATPNRMRGQVTALVLFGFNVIGVGLGPSILAFLTDFVFRDESQIRYALAACYAVISPIAFVILWSGLKPYGRRIAQLEEEEHAKSIG